MIVPRFRAPLAVLIAGAGLAVAFALAAQTARADDAAPLLQFNGKNLDGFYTYLHNNKYEDPDGVIQVKDGNIVISGKEYGGINTKDEYSNYHLVTEWKWGEKTWAPREDKARDSGILVHAHGPDDGYGGHWMESFECQIIEGGTGDFIVVATSEDMSLTCKIRRGEPNNQAYYDENGEPTEFKRGRVNWWGRDPEWKDKLDYRGPKDVEKPAGEWNRLEVVCDGDTITNILNGVVVNEGTKASRTKGKITIQSEGAEIIFRKIEIRPLKKDDK